jgi:protein arginine kinase activator
MGKVCQHCSKREAKIHFTEIKDGKKTEMHICEQCAHNKNIALAFPSLLSHIVKGGGPASESEAVPAACPRCSLTYAEFKAKGRLGCPQCYAAFAPVLATLLEKVHGASAHKGRAPARVHGRRAKGQEMSQLEEDLAHAVENEQYERAAQLRDKIREMKGTPE